MRSSLTLCLYALLCCSGFAESALGCGKLTTDNLDKEFSRAKQVILAFAERVTQTDKHKYPDPHDRIEDVKFRVIFSFKGTKHLGDTLLSHTDLSYGCTASALNSPVWLEEPDEFSVPREAPENLTHPSKISGVWLIFTEFEPFVLSPEPSRPIELVSGTDTLALFRLAVATNKVRQ